MSADLSTPNTVRHLSEAAAAARAEGKYLKAAELYHDAIRQSDIVDERLHLMMREVYCRLAANDRNRGEQLAAIVVTEARSEQCWSALADALGVRVESLMLSDRFGEASEALSELMWVMERVPNETSNYHVIHNTAVTYQRCDFPVQAIELYDRALRLARNDIDRTFTYANLASAYHMAMNYETDPDVAATLLHDGIYAATAALDPESGREVDAEATALAHRSVLLNAIGHHDAALRDASRARALASEHALENDAVVAMVGEAVARWHLHADASVLDLVTDAADRARSLGIETYLKSTGPVSIEILWSEGRYDEAKTVMGLQVDALNRALRRERQVRWEHVRLGVELKSAEALTEADPLTGLPNRRYLQHALPDVLEHHGPVCVALIDLDGFKRINDDFSYEHGDRLLLELSAILQRICRRGDVVVRLGGDEFVLIMRETSPIDARAVLERVGAMIAEKPWQGLPPNLRLTMSAGVSVGSSALDAAQVLAAAGEALHIAKREGRNRVVFA
jgi:diguanylate cyclase (GGDEF)-like protein